MVAPAADPALRPFYRYDVDFQAFRKIISDKSRENQPREIVADVLKSQYEKLGFEFSDHSKLTTQNCFTIVTAHQPSLFLSPLFFVLKAFTAINLVEKLAAEFPENQFLPVFVLGSEDHDLDELNHATVFGKKLVWQTDQTGSVGAMKTDTIRPVLEELKTILGNSENAISIYETIEKAYSSGWTFAEATQFLLLEILGKHGLVVLNMDDARLKRLFIPIMKDELTRQTAFRLVNETTERLNAAGFKTQAAPREINLFYRTEGRRDRIVFSNGDYQILNTSLKFSISHRTKK